MHVPQPTARMPVMSLRGIGKRFGAVLALDDVDLDVHRREVVAVVGDNGAGKSTLAKIIAGVYRPDSGVILSDGIPVTIPSPSAARDLGIATVFQDYPLCENLDVVANLFLGQEVSATVALDEYEMERTTRRVLDRLTTRKLAVRQPVSGLSSGQKQSVAIARSLLGSPRIVILDEPTASLSIAQSAEVLQTIERLRDLDHGIILISHNMAEVQAVADRIVVLRRGRNNGTFETERTSYEDILAAITGAHVALAPARQAPVDVGAKNRYPDRPDRAARRRTLRGRFGGR